jgi:hypothetical protein
MVLFALKPEGNAVSGGTPMTAGRVGTAGYAVMSLLVFSACTNQQPHDTASPSPSGSSTTARPSSSSVGDVEAQPAIDAYKAFDTAANNAYRAPLPFGSTYPPPADFTRYSFDPTRTEAETYLASLDHQGASFRGTPPVPRIRVQSIDLTAKPHPTVVLTDWNVPAILDTDLGCQFG